MLSDKSITPIIHLSSVTDKDDLLWSALMGTQQSTNEADDGEYMR